MCLRTTSENMISLVLLLSFCLQQVGATEPCTRGDVNDISFGNFITHEGHKLSGTPLINIDVKSFFDCLIECTANTQCLSTNVNTTSDVQGLLGCELLGIDKYQHENNLTKVEGVDHYALPTKCDEMPCQHGGKCFPFYANNSYRCECDRSWTTGKNCQITVFYNSCAKLFKAGFKSSDVYDILHPDNTTRVQVYCDMVTSGGGWTVIQKRLDGSVDFYRGWADYKKGFGNKHGEYWLGLDTINAMTSQGSYRLRVDMEDFEGNTRYAEYDSFNVADEAGNYSLLIGKYAGNAGDSLGQHNNEKFSTKDRDNDAQVPSCALKYKGGWWYKSCHASNLNGLYLNGTNTQYAKSVIWSSWKGHYYSLKRVDMKVRPKDF